MDTQKNVKIMKSGTSSQKIKMLVSMEGAVFSRYFDGNLWYSILYGLEDDKGYLEKEHWFEFPVPVSDIGTATFAAQEKAILMMRYIRKHLAMLEEARLTQQGD